VTTVLLGLAVFSLVILSLVAALLLVQRRLLPRGTVHLTVNEDPDRSFDASPGLSLLETLSRQGLLVPSACGGQGTCGACAVRVVEGGGALLATELSHVSRRDAKAGVRLACQLKVRDDLRLELPTEVLGADRWTCRVRSTRHVATYIREIILDLPPEPPFSFRAGAYVEVECPAHDVAFADFDVPTEDRPEWERQGLFRLRSASDEEVVRAYSLAEPPADRGEVVLFVRIATPPPGAGDEVPPGRCSSWLFSRRPGDEVTVFGTFGEFHAKDTDAEMVFIGGGSGMAPLRSIILDQLGRVGTKRTMSFWYGARDLHEAFHVGEFERLAAEHDNFRWHLALSEPSPESGWSGSTGFIHQVVLDEYLATHPHPEDVEFYLCGPPLMLAACRKMLDELGIEEEQVALDDFG
jgi:Na+-transporting NADH:ubiquinone oxidoreductase subunit F